jgi:hypothetical protein
VAASRIVTYPQKPLPPKEQPATNAFSPISPATGNAAAGPRRRTGIAIAAVAAGVYPVDVRPKVLDV